VTESEQIAPVPPFVIAGCGRIRHSALPPEHAAALADTSSRAVVPHAAPEVWGLLFVTDGADHRLTLYSHDPDYVSLLNEGATPIPGAVFHDKFLLYRVGWNLLVDPAAH
jgi:hypothetical protein